MTNLWNFLGSILVGLFSMFGVIYTAKSARKEREISINAKIDGLSAQIKALEKKQDKHNSVIERTFLLEKDVENVSSNIEEIRAQLKYSQAEIVSLNQKMFDIREKEVRLEEKVNNN